MQLKIVYKSIFFLRFLIIRKYNKPVRITAMGNKKIFFFLPSLRTSFMRPIDVL